MSPHMHHVRSPRHVTILNHPDISARDDRPLSYRTRPPMLLWPLLARYALRQAVRAVLSVFFCSTRLLASSSYAGSKKETRESKSTQINDFSRNKLHHVDNAFGIFDASVNKVLDLGNVPGNWLEFAKNRLSAIHNTREGKFLEKCHILGFDILFDPPISETSAMQGNIFSQKAQNGIVNHFKELAFRRKQIFRNEDDQLQQSYLAREQQEMLLEQHFDELTAKMDSLALDLRFGDYQPQVILSDLAQPFMQMRGFYNNTNSRPYLRTGTNEQLKKILTEPEKLSIDLAEATLLLACRLLKKGGKLVIRLVRVDFNDPELLQLQKRLERVFDKVHAWNRHAFYELPRIRTDELFFVCLDKKKTTANKHEVFGP